MSLGYRPGRSLLTRGGWLVRLLWARSFRRHRQWSPNPDLEEAPMRASMLALAAVAVIAAFTVGCGASERDTLEQIADPPTTVPLVEGVGEVPPEPPPDPDPAPPTPQPSPEPEPPPPPAPPVPAPAPPTVDFSPPVELDFDIDNARKLYPPAPPAPAGPASSFGDGTYLVRTDIRAGTYRSDGGEFCYWARLSGLDGELESLIANEVVPSGPALVTIKKSDVGFESQGCGSWDRVGR